MLRFFRRDESVLSALLAENADLRSQLRTEREAWTQERSHLLDRILALSSPGALREVRRAPPQEPAPPAHDRPRRVHYPGYSSSLRPPSPPHLPSPGVSSTSSTFSDVEIQAVLTTTEKRDS